jgi:hypothetical protein
MNHTVQSRRRQSSTFRSTNKKPFSTSIEKGSFLVVIQIAYPFYFAVSLNQVLVKSPWRWGTAQPKSISQSPP